MGQKLFMGLKKLLNKSNKRKIDINIYDQSFPPLIGNMRKIQEFSRITLCLFFSTNISSINIYISMNRLGV